MDKPRKKNKKYRILRIFLKIIFCVVFLLFIFVNYLAYQHAYNFTHFAIEKDVPKLPKSIDKITSEQKWQMLLTGVKNPKPKNTYQKPANAKTFYIPTSRKDTLETWYIENPQNKGIFVIFHGYSNVKSHYLGEAKSMYNLGYHILLVDFSGHGGSTGNVTTIGFYESYDVLAAYIFAQKKHKNIILYGVSMGAVAILKSIHDFQIAPESIILECPFSNLIKTLQNRFEMVGVPHWGLVQLMAFWGGVQNNFSAYDLDVVNFAKKNKIPTLLMYGKKDERVHFSEIEEIYKNISTRKELKVFENVGHSSYWAKYPKDWQNTIQAFLAKNKKNN